jgi:hypothetical protein
MFWRTDNKISDRSVMITADIAIEILLLVTGKRRRSIWEATTSTLFM